MTNVSVIFLQRPWLGRRVIFYMLLGLLCKVVIQLVILRLPFQSRRFRFTTEFPFRSFDHYGNVSFNRTRLVQNTLMSHAMLLSSNSSSMYNTSFGSSHVPVTEILMSHAMLLSSNSSSMYNTSFGSSHVPVTEILMTPAPLSNLQEQAWRIWTSQWMKTQPIERKYLLVSMGNSAFVPFWISWLCNTKLMQGVHNQTLILVTGLAGCANDTFRDFNAATIHCISSDATQIHSNGFPYGSLGYWVITLRRMEHIYSLIDIGISVLVFEPDAVWVQNPLDDPTLFSGIDDMRSLNDAENEYGVGFGWLLLRPTNLTKALFREVIRQYGDEVEKHMHLPMDTSVGIMGEQVYFTQLLHAKRDFPSFSNISITYFERSKYPNGLWYNRDTVRTQVKADGIPYVINNNWIIGNDAKMQRAKQWGHWFTQNEDEGSCKDNTKLRHQLDRMLTTMVTLQPP
jgi:Nucleotide-diphospho-sugar transferase